MAGFRRKFDGHEQQIVFQVELYSFVLFIYMKHLQVCIIGDFHPSSSFTSESCFSKCLKTYPLVN